MGAGDVVDEDVRGHVGMSISDASLMCEEFLVLKLRQGHC
jgi:hypothetical protein